ncbi:transglutaminase family protein [Pleomorphovibrio marinus]|uniref:transglutaminase family protein n=1 Tax=Pleomorphovibrio marinus TaxID=2164132 RepID=UPI000E0A4698|nr:transglutaminase family protein [Pleomorphovibrio marinus]
MLLDIDHLTLYRYQEKVQFNPHQVFLRPLQRHNLILKNYEIFFDPQPDGFNERYSIEGNPYFLAWFSGQHQELSIKINLRILSLPFNPFGFIISNAFVRTLNLLEEPHFSYEEKDMPILHPYLQHQASGDLMDFGKQFLSQRDPLSILTSLNAAIHENWEHIIREEENLWNPTFTYDQKQGSCRDLAWMMMHITRSLGMASRFVSGYAFNPELKGGHELHAWTEVYLPGAGWVGLDPNLGLLVDEHYIPLACSFHPENTLPVHGTTGGEHQVTSKMETKVQIKKLED